MYAKQQMPELQAVSCGAIASDYQRLRVEHVRTAMYALPCTHKHHVFARHKAYSTISTQLHCLTTSLLRSNCYFTATAQKLLLIHYYCSKTTATLLLMTKLTNCSTAQHPCAVAQSLSWCVAPLRLHICTQLVCISHGSMLSSCLWAAVIAHNSSATHPPQAWVAAALVCP